MPKTVDERWIVQVRLPWHDGERMQFSAMTIGFEGRVDRRLAFRMIRKWYKEQIGRTVRKDLMEKVWQVRLQQKAMTETDVQAKIDNMARRSYEEDQNDTDTTVQKEASGEAKL